MKPFLVPTDFSPSADNAARYALQLAKSLRTGIELCHAFTVPEEAPAAAQVAWPLEDYTTVKNHVTAELSRLTGNLEYEERAASTPLSYHPLVNYTSEVGTVKDVIRNKVDTQRLNLVVMGMSGSGGLSRLFLGSNSRELIDVANFPVLLIPPQASFAPIKKIAFATTLDPEDIDIIQALAGMARMFNAEILISHCTDEKYEQHEAAKKADAFLADVTDKARYDKICYRHIKSTGVNRGLDWLSEHGQADLLAMVHHPRHFLEKLLTGSHTLDIARHIPIPLLVFPPGYCGVF